ncbi:alpha-2-macroglobulin-P-like [Clarias gariepinus]|uniref:alpha-2-macroglobulin-P-like n=1 Tax=Clarias gariepinus TaxID=13013 RepID=UPI00234D7151|nr:alpha-2-macroglobulin-P-like [Clarias gariepinus]
MDFIMADGQVHIKIAVLLANLYFLSVYGNTSEPYFMVTFPAVIESGSVAKICMSVLKPNEILQMSIYLVHNNESRTLLQDKVDKEIHQCFHFEAPHVKDNSVQEIKVDVKGESFKTTEKRKVMFKPYGRLFFIQTDKPIYNPGQTVNFRIVSTDVNFIPVEQKYTTVSLQDNHQNRIGQWTNVSSSGLIVQLFHELNSEAPEGSYKITANTGNRLITHDFKVEKYVLPKFKVTIKEHIVGEEELKLEVCAHYTYEQPVPGQAEVKACGTSGMSYLCIVSFPGLELGQNGCGFIILNVSNFRNQLVATILFKEEGTDISVEKSKEIRLSFQVGKVEILVSQNNFEWGNAIKGKVKVTNYNGTPIANKKVYLREKNQQAKNISLILTTDGNGLANFSVASPKPPTTSITLTASVYSRKRHHAYKAPFFANAEVNIKQLQPDTTYSPMFSELSIESLEEQLRCGAEIPITVYYYIVGETTRSYSIDLIYMVLSKGVIVHHGHEKVEVEDSLEARKGKILLNLSIVAEMAPVMHIVVYSVLPSKRVIAARKTFDVEKCFSNKVSLQFSPTKSVPGEKNTLKLSAHPGSLCGLSAVDQSVFIVESGDRLNIEKIYNLLPVTSVSGYPLMVEDNRECLQVRHSRQVQSDRVYDTLKGVGLKMATNLAVGVPQCLRYKGVMYHHIENSSGRVGLKSEQMDLYDPPDYLLPIGKDREFFPETWIWQLVEVGDSGSVQIPVTVPDTITTWETEAFCVSPKGLGLAPTIQLTVFQPFFLELSMPYAIIQGEVFELKATVVNNLSKCIMVKVTPSPSSDYRLEPSSDGKYSSCLCANSRKTFKWTLIPSVLGVVNVTVSAEAEQSQTMCDNEIVSVPERGRIDTVKRSLIVQAEGTERTKSQSWLLCPQGSSVSEEFELTLPENVIAGSARASVSVLGDTLGRALRNPDKLLKMVNHCGEGNIALLSSNICIVQYLKNTEQLTTAVQNSSTRFLKSGYQRQLKYKDNNGAYSTFSGGKGSTWLTAFVLRTLGKAQHYIFIDPEIIDSAKQWLISMQRSDGCFIHHGHFYDNRMKDGVNDDVTITAYITLSFLELGMTVQDPVVNKGLMCLRSSTGSLANTYTTALLAYTFSLARENETREQLLKELNSVAITEDGNLHWSQSTLDDSGAFSVEISSYVLLAVLTAGQLSAADLGYANRIVRWLVKQQNPSGDFSSTQDTVVALQALALYSTKVFSSDGSSSVTVKSSGGDRHSFDVNENNKLLYQERSLQDIPDKYNIEVKGSTCVSVQTALFYNVPTPTETSTLSIMATTEESCTKSFRQTLTIKFSVTYNGRLNSTNMIIVDIKLLSGFTADPDELETQILVDKVDSKEDHIVMYIKKLQRNIPISYELHIQQVFPVKNIKPAVIKVYDYYKTSDQSETEYTSLCV